MARLPANLSPAAQLFAQVYNKASQPSSLRGLATNVANYNGWSLTTCPSYTSGDSNCDEKKYINALDPLLQNFGWDARFITDTEDDLEDAYVWVKPGGESDDTSDTTSSRYDAHCGYSDALQPAPEAGTWFQVCTKFSD